MITVEEALALLSTIARLTLALKQAEAEIEKLKQGKDEDKDP